jgi:NitT/TauT family transport system substrate-binding protein
MLRALLLASSVLTLPSALAHAADRVIWLNDWLPAGDNSPIYYGVASGIFSRAGIDVIIQNAKGSSDVVTRLATGSAQFGIAGIAALMQAKAEGRVPVTAVMSVYNTAPDVIVTYRGSGITRFADVAGKTIATPSFSASNVIWPLMLERNGLKAGDVTLLKVDPSALAAMLATGRVQGTINWLPTAAGYEATLAEAGKTMEVIPWSQYGLDIYGVSVLASDAVVREKPELVGRFVTAYKQAIREAKAHPNDSIAALKAAVPDTAVVTARKELDAGLSLTLNDRSSAEGLGSFEPGRLKKTWDLVAKAQGLSPDKLDPETVVSRAFSK